MLTPIRNRNGQVLLMVTFSITAIIGMIALAMDVGFAQYVRRNAQRAADAAALAGAYRVFATSAEDFSIECGGEVTCQQPTACPQDPTTTPGNTAEAACLYAAMNAFKTQGESGRQTVLVSADRTSPPPTAPGVVTLYWVTVETRQTVPQLWAAVLGQPMNVTARATAAIVDAEMTASLVLLNRENDCIPMESNSQLTCGVDLLVSANDNAGNWALRADGGIYMASNKHGASADGRYAGENTGGGTVHSPFTRIRGTGWYTLSNNAQWIETPTNHDSRAALDPMQGKGQPLPPSAGLADHQILGGLIAGSNDPNNPTVLTPGNYYATSTDNNGNIYATGDPIRVSGNVRFSSGGTFGDFVFFGGFQNQSGGTVVQIEPGRYFFAGVKPKNNGDPNPLFSVSSNMSLIDPTMGNTSSAGEIFVFTDTNYSAVDSNGSMRALSIPALVYPIASQLKQGNAGFQTGNNANISMQLQGLNYSSPNLPLELAKFSRVLMWQDQANSVVKYDRYGNYVNCGSYICPNTALASNKSPELFLQGSPAAFMTGTIYQPRGAWTTVQGGGTYTVPVQLIAGALKLQGNSSFQMQQVPLPVTVKTVTLVE